MSEVGLYQSIGWKKPMMMYRFRCEKHGWVVSTLQGYHDLLLCPICAVEEFRRASSELVTKVVVASTVA